MVGEIKEKKQLEHQTNKQTNKQWYDLTILTILITILTTVYNSVTITMRYEHVMHSCYVKHDGFLNHGALFSF